MTMHIPTTTQWFIAQIVQKYIVGSDSEVLVHVNYTLLRASTAEAAFLKAEEIGRSGEMKYVNPDKQEVLIKYIGLRDLVPLYEPLEDGCELLFEEHENVSEESASRIARSKESLACFRSDEELQTPKL